MTRSLLTALALLAFAGAPAHAAMSRAADDASGRRSRGRRARGSRHVDRRCPRHARVQRRSRAVTARARSGPSGAHVVPRDNARAFAAALRRRGCSSSRSRTSSAGRVPRAIDPFTSSARWRPAVVEEGLEPPAVTSSSPKLALIDSKLDESHPEFAGGRIGSVGAQLRRGRARDGDGRGGRRAHERARDRRDLAGHDRHELRDGPLVRRHRPPDPGGRSGAATTCST